MVRSVADDAATAVVWPAITFKPAPVPGRVAAGQKTPSVNTGASTQGAAEGDGGGDDWSDAQSAFAEGGGGNEGDSGPPLEELESRMGAEIAGRDDGAARPGDVKGSDEGDDTPIAMPELDALVARIPPEVREALDELFRARFQAVRRVPRKALGGATGKTLAP